MKVLIAYYSRRGQNYVDGNIVSLPVGNNEVVAGKGLAVWGRDAANAQDDVSAWLRGIGFKDQ